MREICCQIRQVLRAFVQQLEDIVAEIPRKEGYNTCGSITEARPISSSVGSSKED